MSARRITIEDVRARMRLEQVRAIVTDALPPLKAAVAAELAAGRRDR
jgi:hypothetical protein